MNKNLILKLTLLFFLLPICLLLFLNFNTVTKKLTIYMIGDSTMADKPVENNPERGWGQLFPIFFNENVKVDNRAMNGRSSRTFLEENRWQPIVDSLKPGDYVFIQFGHNDQSKEKKDRYTSPADYRNNLIKFVIDTRSKKAIPILCTSVVRRKFNDEGILLDTHGHYPELTRQVAKEYNVLLIDLQKKSERLVQSYGVEASKQLYLWIFPGLYKYLPSGKQDNTHFSEVGAFEMAKLAVEGLKDINSDLVNFLKK